MVPNDQLSAARVTRRAASSRGGGPSSPHIKLLPSLQKSTEVFSCGLGELCKKSMFSNRRPRDLPSLPLHSKFNHRMAPQSLESAVQSHFSRPSKDAGVGIKFARCLFSRPAPSRHNQMLAQLLSGLHAPLRDPSTPCHICRSHTSDALFSMVETLAVS